MRRYLLWGFFLSISYISSISAQDTLSTHVNYDLSTEMMCWQQDPTQAM